MDSIRNDIWSSNIMTTCTCRFQGGLGGHNSVKSRICCIWSLMLSLGRLH